jgi:hypothetical protein
MFFVDVDADPNMVPLSIRTLGNIITHASIQALSSIITGLDLALCFAISGT